VNLDHALALLAVEACSEPTSRSAAAVAVQVPGINTARPAHPLGCFPGITIGTVSSPVAEPR